MLTDFVKVGRGSGIIRRLQTTVATGAADVFVDSPQVRDGYAQEILSLSLMPDSVGNGVALCAFVCDETMSPNNSPILNSGRADLSKLGVFLGAAIPGNVPVGFSLGSDSRKIVLRSKQFLRFCTVADSKNQTETVAFVQGANNSHVGNPNVANDVVTTNFPGANTKGNFGLAYCYWDVAWASGGPFHQNWAAEVTDTQGNIWNPVGGILQSWNFPFNAGGLFFVCSNLKPGANNVTLAVTGGPTFNSDGLQTNLGIAEYVGDPTAIPISSSAGFFQDLATPLALSVTLSTIFPNQLVILGQNESGVTFPAGFTLRPGSMAEMRIPAPTKAVYTITSGGFHNPVYWGVVLSNLNIGPSVPGSFFNVAMEYSDIPAEGFR